MHSNNGSSTPPVAEVPAPDPVDEQAAEDALAGGAETGDPTEDAAPVDTPEDGTADASPTPPPREASPTPETAREAPAPVDEEEDLDEADMDDIPAAATRSDAEERRRREMEESAERARAERRAREEEKARKAQAAAPPTGTPRMKSLPLTVVDTMIRSNMSVKRCFFAEKQASGSLPSRVNVRFTVMPTGRVSAARVTTDEYKGGSLDSCLGRSFKAIQFPAFEGDPLSMTYPFIL
jgi:outer membrane biosynthesis protein TonB